MHALHVKFVPATNSRGARFCATFLASKLNSHYGYAYSLEENYRFAALQLLKKLKLEGAWLGAELPDNSWSFICIDDKAPLCVGI